MDILVDSNVILDIVTEDKKWFPWSSQALAKYAETHTLVINPIIYAEVSVGFDRIEDVEEVLPSAFFRRDPIPWEAAFLTAKCFLAYRRSWYPFANQRYRSLSNLFPKAQHNHTGFITKGIRVNFLYQSSNAEIKGYNER
jgi:hypothetical protein